MDKKRLYKMAYRMLDGYTPLRFDCGILCGGACCKGDDDTGMYLFPGEDAVYEACEPGASCVDKKAACEADAADFLRIKPANLEYGDGRRALLAVCDGKCIRSMRPLSCRIFPLAPHTADGRNVIVRMDPRATAVCPIAGYLNRSAMDCIFVRRVRNVFRMLMGDEDIKSFIIKLSQMLDAYSSLQQKFMAGIPNSGN